MSLIFFVYGLSFFILGFALFLYPKNGSHFRLARYLWLIGLFGVLHGLTEWIDMALFLQAQVPWMGLKVLRFFLLPCSFIALVFFGSDVMRATVKRPEWTRVLPFVAIMLWAFIVAGSRQTLLLGDISARYFIALPGIFMTAYVLRLQIPDCKEKGMFTVARDLRLASWAFISYGFLAGCIVPKTDFFPASALNYSSFKDFTGLPVQLFRAASAVAATIAMIRLLRVFDWEAKVAEQRLLAETKKSKEQVEAAYKQLQETQNLLVDAERFTAVGQLASGVAHEVRNPLAIILQASDYLNKRLAAQPADILDILTMIKDNVKRADTIVRGLLDFSKTAPTNLQAQDLNSILEAAVFLVQYRTKFVNIDIERELQADVPSVLMDKGKGEQVFVNLLMNAAQAMPQGGKLFVRSRVGWFCDDDRRVTMDIPVGSRPQDRAVIVEIEDTGVGISRDNMKKLFLPFFTTKGPRDGTGLGLSVTKGIMDMHKGCIQIQSEEGKGTKIILGFRVVNS